MPRTPFFHRRSQRKKPMPILFRGNREQETELKIVAHATIDTVVLGQGSLDDWLTICFRIFVGRAMAMKLNEVDQVNQVLDKALGALWFVGERIKKKHKVGFSGGELNAIKEAVNLVDSIQDATTMRDHRDTYQHAVTKVGGWDLTMSSLQPFKEVFV